MTRVGKIAIVVTFGAMCVFEQGLWSARPAAGAAAAVDWSAVPAKASVASAVAAAVDVTPAKAVVAAAPVMPPPVTPSFKQPAVFYTDRCGSFGIAVGDLDGEDGLDLVVCSKDRPQSWNPACTATTRTGITVFLNSGDGAGEYTVDRDPYGIAAGQIAGDVKVDLVTANMHGDSGGTTDNFHGNITVLVNKGLTGNPAQLTFDRTDFKVMSSGSRPKPAQVLLADLNGDGQKDVITANWNAASVSVLINTYVQTLP